MSSAGEVLLNCMVPEDGSVFQVPTDLSKRVADLKADIKAANPGLANYNAEGLQLILTEDQPARMRASGVRNILAQEKIEAN